ncbi:hypothetical protein AB1Y20_012472 [Prymnesium parvum]|uniref:Uncharacterized protein n=1 Tax=Prymnesium parvum TaxID=97485 RepID=A0AB34IKR7_PRYPA
MESSAMRTNYPETQRYLAARRAMHPRLDAIEDYTEWTLLGQPTDGTFQRPPLPGRTVPSQAPAASTKREETMEEYVERRCEEYMHKSLSSRRSVGGKLFTIGGGGDGGCGYQVIG